MPPYALRDHVAAFPAGCAAWPPADLLAALGAARDGGARVALLAFDGTAAVEWDGASLLCLERHRLPTVAALSGTLTGYAVDLALACDIRIAAADLVLRCDRVGSRRMIVLLGTAGCTEVLGRGGEVDAATALDLGLVSQCAADAAGLSADAQALAATIAARGPIATELGKEALWRGLAMPLEQALRFETDLTMLLQTTNDRAEGVRAFIEKRPPQFTGK